MTQHQELREALSNLEAALQAADLWTIVQPEAKAFESTQPFCIDTMTLPQWLRFLLVPRLWSLIDAKATLPTNSQIAPAAEVYMQDYSLGARQSVVGALQKLDRVMNEGGRS
ncbi:YqcC family protein [Phytohalomonas tamaricis]|uniref:YqcC family protein n=1 Tax=Phytohalomonas tamaricis TaxID=2081032 RepID=UPI000D0AE801|nr:YqcC family protein [Phytohalomonas tamaricis]